MRFIIYVLWMAGFSAGQIAKQIRSRPKVVLGIAQKAPYPVRATMTLSQRQAALDELRAIRCDRDGVPIDGGALDAAAFIARPARGRDHFIAPS